MFSNLTLDCSGGLHLLVDTPLETNVNLAALKTLWDVAGDGITARAQAAWYVTVRQRRPDAVMPHRHG